MTALQISTCLEVKAAKCKALITHMEQYLICKCTTIKKKFKKCILLLKKNALN